MDIPCITEKGSALGHGGEARRQISPVRGGEPGGGVGRGGYRTSSVPGRRRLPHHCSLYSTSTLADASFSTPHFAAAVKCGVVAATIVTQAPRVFCAGKGKQFGLLASVPEVRFFRGVRLQLRTSASHGAAGAVRGSVRHSRPLPSVGCAA